MREEFVFTRDKPLWKNYRIFSIKKAVCVINSQKALRVLSFIFSVCKQIQCIIVNSGNTIGNTVLLWLCLMRQCPPWCKNKFPNLTPSNALKSNLTLFHTDMLSLYTNVLCGVLFTFCNCIKCKKIYNHCYFYLRFLCG